MDQSCCTVSNFEIINQQVLPLLHKMLQITSCFRLNGDTAVCKISGCCSQTADLISALLRIIISINAHTYLTVHRTFLHLFPPVIKCSFSLVYKVPIREVPCPLSQLELSVRRRSSCLSNISSQETHAEKTSRTQNTY